MSARPVEPAAPRPCSACPWRTSNHGKPHPDGWYTARNRERLWGGLRRGVSMTCHPTDPDNPVPASQAPVSPSATTHECTGGHVLQQRELHYLDRILRDGGTWADYRRAHPRGLTREGAAELVSRLAFGGLPLVGGAPMSRPNLNEPDVSHPPLDTWGPVSD